MQPNPPEYPLNRCFQPTMRKRRAARRTAATKAAKDTLGLTRKGDRLSRLLDCYQLPGDFIDAIHELLAQDQQTVAGQLPGLFAGPQCHQIL